MTPPLSTEAVWTAMSADLRRWLRQRVRDDHAAEDLLQETFLRIHGRLDTLRDGDRLGAWVTRIARNVLLDHARRRAARPDTRAATDVRADVTADVTAETAADTAADEAALRDARAGEVDAPGRPLAWVGELVDALPATYREAVRLSEIEGLSGREVAARLGLGLSATKSRIQRGRALMKQALETCCRFEFDRRGNLLGWERRDDTPPCGDCGG